MEPQSLPPFEGDLNSRPSRFKKMLSIVFGLGLTLGIAAPKAFDWLQSSAQDSRELAPSPKLAKAKNSRLKRVALDSKAVESEIDLKTLSPKAKPAAQPMSLAAKNKAETQEAASPAGDSKSAKSPKKAETVAEPILKSGPSKLAQISDSPLLLEEVPSSVSAKEVEDLQNLLAKHSKPESSSPYKAVAYTPTLEPAARVASLPLGKSRKAAKAFAVVINNVSFSKENLSQCTRRCALMATDASGQPVRAVFDATTFASALEQHKGTINISGQPKLIKNQQVLIVENITFNLAAEPSRSMAMKARKAKPSQQALPVSLPAKSSNNAYIEVNVDADGLRPGTVIKSRRQIPNEGLESEGL